jgi:hypothetical protein
MEGETASWELTDMPGCFAIMMSRFSAGDDVGILDFPFRLTFLFLSVLLEVDLLTPAAALALGLVALFNKYEVGIGMPKETEVSSD